MSKYKTRLVEHVLMNVPPEKWGVANEVSAALIGCNHVKMMVRNAMNRNYVRDIYEEEIISETAFIMQTRCIAGGLSHGDREKGKLQKISDVYFLIYQTINNICLNYKKKRQLTKFSLEDNFSSFASGEEDIEDFVLDQINDNESFDPFLEVNRNLDMELAKKQFAQKLADKGWPDHIPRERSIKGRPSTLDKDKFNAC